jgi:hypothetical protein
LAPPLIPELDRENEGDAKFVESYVVPAVMVQSVAAPVPVLAREIVLPEAVAVRKLLSTALMADAKPLAMAVVVLPWPQE